MVFSDAPAPLNGVVFAMVWGIIGETHRHLILLDKLYHPLHALGSATMIFWAIIHLEDQRGHVGKPRADGLPPLPQAVRQAVTAHFGGHPLHQQFVKRGEENANGCEGGLGVKVVIDRRDEGATLPPTRQRPHFDEGFGIHREA
jgi:hypothetical protein